MACGENNGKSGCARHAIEASIGVSCQRTVAKAHTVLERPCAVNSEVASRAAAESSFQNGRSLTSSTAQAHSVLDSSVGRKIEGTVASLGVKASTTSTCGTSKTSTAAKAQSVFASSCAGNSRRRCKAKLDKTSSWSSFYSRRANAHSVLANAWGLALCQISFRVARACKICLFGNRQTAQAQAMLDKFCASKTSIPEAASSASSPSNYWFKTQTAAKAHAVFATSWGRNSPSFHCVCAAITFISGRSQNCSLATDHTILERCCGRKAPLSQPSRLLEITESSGESANRSVANAQAKLASS